MWPLNYGHVMKLKRIRDKAQPKKVMLYESDKEIVIKAAERLGGTSFSDTLQKLIQEYGKLVFESQ